MKRFLRFNNRDKQDVKMINQTDNGFELVVLSEKCMKELLEKIHKAEECEDTIDVIWQMKWKSENYKQYKNCIFSAPMDNYHNGNLLGRKFKVTCSETGYYTTSNIQRNRFNNRSKIAYKDMTLLIRMLKISELNEKSDV